MKQDKILAALERIDKSLRLALMREVFGKHPSSWCMGNLLRAMLDCEDMKEYFKEKVNVAMRK